EIRVPRRDLCASDSVALQPARLEHQPSCQLVVGVLENASERPLVGRLRGLAQRLKLGDLRLDLAGIPPLEPKFDPRDHLSLVELRLPVREAELSRLQPA